MKLFYTGENEKMFATPVVRARGGGIRFARPFGAANLILILKRLSGGRRRTEYVILFSSPATRFPKNVK